MGGARAAARRRRGGRARTSCSTSRTSERGDFERGLAEADVVVEATYRTQVVLHNSMETHQSVVPVGRRHARGATSRRSTSGASAPSSPRRLGLAARQGAGRLRVHGRRLRLEERPRRLHVHRGRARAAHGPARPLRAHPPRGERRRREPERDDPAARRRRARRRDAHRARRRVRQRDRLLGLELDGRGPDAEALRLPERAHDDAAAPSSTCRR